MTKTTQAKIVELRQLGYTQCEIAAVTGFTQAAISRVGTGARKNPKEALAMAVDTMWRVNRKRIDKLVKNQEATHVV